MFYQSRLAYSAILCNKALWIRAFMSGPSIHGYHNYLHMRASYSLIYLRKLFPWLIICQSIYESTSGLAGKNLRDLFPRVRGKKVGKKGLLTSFSPGFSPQWGKNLFRLICSHNPSDRGPSTLNFVFILFKGYLGQNRAYIDSKTISIDNTTYPIIITNRV